MHKSPVWSVSKEELQALYDTETSVTNILKHLGLDNKGNNFRTLKQRVLSEGICLEQYNINKAKIQANTRIFCQIPLEDILKENSTYNRSALKKRLIKAGLLVDVCENCGLEPLWMGQRLVLQLEHKNGVSTDNRLDNLCLLCPNCHSQTGSFAGRKLKRKRIDKGDPRPKMRKVEWPSKEQLQKLLWEKPTKHIAQDYGVSDKSVEKWAKKFGLSKPPRGYWQKLNIV